MLAAASPHDGTAVTSEIDPEVANVALELFEKSPDGGKLQYLDYYEHSLGMLSVRGIIAVDNVLWGGRVLNPESEEDRAIAAFNTHVAQDPRVPHVLLPVCDGVMLIHEAEDRGWGLRARIRNLNLGESRGGNIPLWWGRGGIPQL